MESIARPAAKRGGEAVIGQEGDRSGGKAGARPGRKRSRSGTLEITKKAAAARWNKKNSRTDGAS
jgi:hypothetical protein